MVKQVKNYIVKELKTAKYFSVSVDSTPDLVHVDQLTVIVRYVVSGKPVERFLTFLQTGSHKAEVLATSLLEFLEKEGIDFDNCRGQSYDNANNMSGRYTGMQARLKDKNPVAVFIPCAAHSLNLVGQAAASCCSLFDTRWSARVDATKALVEGYNQIQNALRDIESDLEQTPEARHEARTLADKMDNLETALMVKIWNLILVRFNSTNKAFQGVEIDLKKVLDLINSLERFLESLRNRYEERELDARSFCGNTDYKAATSRPRKINKRLRSEAEKLTTAFPRDFSYVFIEEIVQFAAFAELRLCLTPSQQAVLLHDEGVASTFPGVNVALRIYLSMMVTNCSEERSFSKLALIKNYLRTTMTHERLSALCLLDVESSVLKMMQFEEKKDFL
ncbi:hypothetical protein RN001_004393 [Aquatica leii]|uniref:HAT C-terminal dimerisation domain-containing protein n=1 Tax=Aquatica leii TaxID=1421715 RepID=A0AAN7PYE3_9COLE|nr:hypothetical protein RN001_004393 [Aquatica leii]